MSAPNKLPALAFTPAEYLTIERFTEIRHEYLDGFVYAMAGESPRHSIICYNLAGMTYAQLRGKPCQGFSPNMKARAGTKGLYAYPDLMIVCGEPAFHDEERDVITNPTVIFEVLSPSTEAYDRGEKFLRYRTHIESLQDYVLVAQDQPRLEHYARQPDGTWTRAEISGLTSAFSLPSIGCLLPLAEVYDRITFSAP